MNRYIPLVFCLCAGLVASAAFCGDAVSQTEPEILLKNDVYYFDFSLSDPAVIYAVVGSDIQKSADAGQHWKKITSLSKIVSLVVDDNDPDMSMRRRAAEAPRRRYTKPRTVVPNGRRSNLNAT